MPVTVTLSGKRQSGWVPIGNSCYGRVHSTAWRIGYILLASATTTVIGDFCYQTVASVFIVCYENSSTVLLITVRRVNL